MDTECALNIETDERPPSILKNFIDDSLDKSVNLNQPESRPIPSWLPEFYQLSKDINSLCWDNRVKYAILCHCMAKRGVIKLDEMSIKYPKEKKHEPRDYTGFPDFVEMSGANEDTFLKMERVAKELKALTEKEDNGKDNGKGPYLEYDKEGDVYGAVHEVVLDATALSYGKLFPHHTVMTCRPEFIYNYCKPADIIKEGEKKKVVELFDSACNHTADRLIKRIVEGHVNEAAGSCMFDSDLFKEAFFRRLEKNEKTSEVLQAFDKDSTGDTVKTLLYCLVAQTVPKFQFVKSYLQAFREVQLETNVSKEKQILKTLEAACRWGHYEVYCVLLEGIEHPLPFNVLRKAVVGGNSSIVESLLMKQEWSQQQLDKAFEWACFCGVETIYSALRDRGAIGSDLCLFESAFGGNVKIFTDLCQQGYDYEKEFDDGRTALHTAVEQGNSSIVEFLLQRGVDPHLKTKSGKIPLLMAAENGRDDVAEILLLIGGDPNIRDSKQSTALHKACAKGSYRLFERLLNVGGDITAVDQNGASIFHKAVFGGNKEIIDQLLRNGFQLDTLDSLGNSVLHICSVQGHQKLLEEYVDKNPTLISSLNKFFWNPVMCAAYAGHVGTFEFLAQNGGDIVQVTLDGRDIMQLTKCGREKRQQKEIWFEEQFGEFIKLGAIEDYDTILKYLVETLK